MEARWSEEEEEEEGEGDRWSENGRFSDVEGGGGREEEWGEVEGMEREARRAGQEEVEGGGVGGEVEKGEEERKPERLVSIQ